MLSRPLLAASTSAGAMSLPMEETAQAALRMSLAMQTSADFLSADLSSPPAVGTTADQGAVSHCGLLIAPVQPQGLHAASVSPALTAIVHKDPAPTDLTAGGLEVTPGLQSQVTFWKRVYTQIDSQHGYIHDAWHLNVVYRTVAVPHLASRRANSRALAEQLRHVASLLSRAADDRAHLSDEQVALLGAWPAGVDAVTLRNAARNVRFQKGQSDHFRAGLIRAQTWMPYIETTFARANLPKALAALPHVESSFNMHAYSQAKAAGIFQFIPATARLFMHIDSAVDERYDPIRATEGAAALLAQNYRLLGSWPLAITAYNHGPAGMRRAAATMGTSDLATIIAGYKSRHFGFASRNFYTELLAAYEVSQHPSAYFGDMTSSTAVTYTNVTTDAFYGARAVARALGVDTAVLRAHNPALRSSVWAGVHRIPRGFTLRVPTEAVNGDLVAALASIDATERFAHAVPTVSRRTALAQANRRSRPSLVAQRTHARGHTLVASRTAPKPPAAPAIVQAPDTASLPWNTPSGHAKSFARPWFE